MQKFEYPLQGTSVSTNDLELQSKSFEKNHYTFGASPFLYKFTWLDVARKSSKVVVSNLIF